MPGERPVLQMEILIQRCSLYDRWPSRANILRSFARAQRQSIFFGVPTAQAACHVSSTDLAHRPRAVAVDCSRTQSRSHCSRSSYSWTEGLSPGHHSCQLLRCLCFLGGSFTWAAASRQTCPESQSILRQEASNQPSGMLQDLRF